MSRDWLDKTPRWLLIGVYYLVEVGWLICLVLLIRFLMDLFGVRVECRVNP